MFLKENTHVCVKEKCLVHHHRRMQRGVAGRRMRWGVADNTEDTRGYRRERVVRCLMKEGKGVVMWLIFLASSLLIALVALALIWIANKVILSIKRDQRKFNQEEKEDD